jgi:hypothetical protein
MQEIQIITNDLLTKKSRQELANTIIEQLEGGELNPLKIHVQVKAMEDLIKKILDSKVYKDCLLSECDKNGKKFDFFGAEFMQKETGTKYDYSNCGDNTILDLSKQLETLKEQIKKREEFLKMIPIEGVETITSDGEVVTLYPPSKSSTTSVQVTFK